MTVVCDFDVAVRIIADDGTTERIDLNTPNSGLSVESVQEPEDNVRDIRTSAPRVDGSFRVAEADDDGILLVILRIDGATWAAVETGFQSVRTAYRAETRFYIETEVEGVTKRWRTERPDVAPAVTESTNLYTRSQTYSMRFRVQPNPTVTIA